MSRYELPPEEIQKRLIRLRNLERLHAEQRLRNEVLTTKNRALEAEVARLNLVVSEQQRIIDDLRLQVEELRTMVFGKKKKAKEVDDDDIFPPREKVIRTSESHKRPIPRDEEVTEVQHHTLLSCVCGEEVTEKKIIVYYEEDIPLPVKKIVRKHTVEKGYCVSCKKWSIATPLPAHKVILGPNIQKSTTPRQADGV